jgi:hypothetical protein
MTLIETVRGVEGAEEALAKRGLRYAPELDRHTFTLRNWVALDIGQRIPEELAETVILGIAGRILSNLSSRPPLSTRTKVRTRWKWAYRVGGLVSKEKCLVN